MGPCSIHDPAAGLDYARRLRRLADEVSDVFQLVMNTQPKPIMSYAVRPVPAIVAANNHHADTAADRLQAMREYLGSLMERAVDDTDGDVNEALVEALASIDMAASGMWSST